MSQIYIVLEVPGEKDALEQAVNIKIREGYKPIGGVTSVMYPGKIKPTFYQAMVSTEKATK
jgi:hypothetical protein